MVQFACAGQSPGNFVALVSVTTVSRIGTEGTAVVRLTMC